MKLKASTCIPENTHLKKKFKSHNVMGTDIIFSIVLLFPKYATLLMQLNFNF